MIQLCSIHVCILTVVARLGVSFNGPLILAFTGINLVGRDSVESVKVVGITLTQDNASDSLGTINIPGDGLLGTSGPLSLMTHMDEQHDNKQKDGYIIELIHTPRVGLMTEMP